MERGLTYPCFCSHADLHAAEAPHASDGTPIYAGTCRDLTPEQVAERRRRRNPGVRLRVPSADDPAGTVRFVDEVYGAREECLARECGDFIVRRSDGVYAYQLAVTVDDALMGVTRVVRGCDLLPSTARQIYLQSPAGVRPPVLRPRPAAAWPRSAASAASRSGSATATWASCGTIFGRPEVLLGRLAALGGLRPHRRSPVSAAELAETFTWDAVRAHRRRHPRAGELLLLRYRAAAPQAAPLRAGPLGSWFCCAYGKNATNFPLNFAARLRYASTARGGLTERPKVLAC